MLLLPLVACHPDKAPSDSADTAPVDPTFADPDGATFASAADGSFVWTLADGSVHTVRLSLGVTAGAEDTVNYDPWALYDDPYGAVPGDLTFVEPTSATWSGAAYDLALADGSAATLTVDDAGPGLRLSLRQPDGAAWAPYARVSVSVGADEAFYGLGEVFGHVQHRGSVVPMQFEIDPSLESGYNETHVPVPLLVSSASWGLLADSYRPGTFDVAATSPDTIVVTFNTSSSLTADDAGLDVDLYAPPTPPEVTARYYARTGPPEIPPDWAFAPFQWRNVVDGSGDVRDDLQAIRALGVPTGTIWVDNPWQTTYNSMVPDEAMFPDWGALVDELHDQGFRVMAWNTPYVEESDPDHAAYASAGWFVDAPILFSDFGDWVDFTQPDAMGAWNDRVSAAAALGIEGWKLDYGEDAQLGIGANRLAYRFADGSDERTMHHQSNLYYAHAYADPYPDHDGFLLGRGGALGGHTVTDCIWPGDLDSDFHRFGEDGYVGGLPSAIRAGTGLSVSGYGFFASDTGGYRNGRPSKETMIRWTEYSATLPVMQYGGGGDDHNPWNFTDYGDSQFDQETLDTFIRYASLHTRLYPYFRHLADRLSTEGLPIVLPEGLVARGVDVDDAYLVGDDLFVAPVEEAGATTRTLTLPPGEWVHWWTGELASGALTVDAPLGAGPLYQRVGSIVPMLRRSVVTLSPAGDGVDSFDSDPGALNARIVPGSGAAITLATGESMAAEAAGSVTLTAGSLYVGWDVEVYAPTGTSVEVDGASFGAGVEGCDSCWIGEAPWVRVVLPAGDHTIAVR